MAVSQRRRFITFLHYLTDALTNPGYNLKMRWRYLQHVGRQLLGQKRVTGIEIQNTYRCNARCSFCSMGDSLHLNRDMDPVVFDRVLDEAKKEGVLLIVFLGGETLVDRNIWSYLDKCWDAGIRVEIQSNGTLLTEANLIKLKKAHVQNVAVTVHGTTAEEHDGIYQIQGSFDRLRHALDFAKSIGLSMSLKSLYSKRREDDGSFARILNLAKEQNLSLNVNPFMPVGSGFGDEERLDAASVQKFRKIMTTEDRVSSHVYIDKQPTGCFAGKDYFCVTPDGDLLPCFFMPLSVGNIKTMSLRQAHELVMKIPIFAERFPVCYVAASENFYEKCLVPLHKNYTTLPVNIVEHPEVYELLKQFNMVTL